jgi:dienelactone hydrolase
MTRREYLALCAGAAFVPGAIPAFAAVNYRQYSRCLPDYLRQLAARAYQTREQAIAQLTTPEAVRARQHWARETFWRLTGGEPERTPLAVATTGRFERQGYRVEKLVYQSRPGFYIPANLYIPEGRPPFPGVLFQMGHSGNGKAYAPYQRCCQGLARLGYLVLAFDPIGQGERIFYPGVDPAKSRLNSPTDEHTTPGRQLLLYGDTMSRLQVWDAIRSLDVLASHPMVDPKRLASTGQSGGGTLTMMLAAVDDRLAAAAVSSGNTENFACAGFDPPGSTDDAEQDFVASGPLGFDRWDLLYPFAPKPLWISVSAKDFFGTYSPQYLANGRPEFEKLKRVYQVLGNPSQLEWVETPLPHNLSYDSRLGIYRWFQRWLMPGAPPVTDEPPTAPEDDRVLYATESGSVVKSLHSTTPFELNRSRKLSTRPADPAALLGVARPAPGLSFTRVAETRSGDIEIEAVEVPSAPQVWIPAWIFRPRSGSPGRAFLLLEPDSRSSRWHEGELYQTLASRSALVCVPDLRGIGDLRPEYSRGDAHFAAGHNSDESYAWASLILGSPLVGQWATDILALIAALKQRTPSLKLTVAARGRVTVAALIAASLDERIDTLYLAGGLISWTSLAETENYRHPLANFVPGVLLHTDLPALAGQLGNGKLVIGGAVDAGGDPADPDLVKRLYPGARVLRQGRWDAAALASFTAGGAG